MNKNNFKIDDDLNTIFIFSSLIALVLALCYYIARIGFDNPILPVIKVLLISFFILLLPQGFDLLTQKLKLSMTKTWITNPAFFCLLALILLCISANTYDILQPILLSIFCVISLIIFLINSVIFIRSGTVKQNLFFISITLLFSLWLALTFWDNSYFSTVFMEKIMIGEALHIDTLFHTSIINMIKTYNIPSTGLEGTIYVPYHTGSHWIFAQLSKLLDIPSLIFFNMGFPIIFLPLLFQSIILLAHKLKFTFFQQNNYKKLSISWQFWLVLFAGFIGFLPKEFKGNLAIFNTSALISPSHEVGLCLVFLTLCILIDFIHKNTSNNSLKLNNSTKLVNKIFLWAILPFLIGILFWFKISLGALIFGSVCYFFLRCKLYKNPTIIISFILTTALVLFFYKVSHISSAAQNSASPEINPIELFGFWKKYVKDGWLFFWIPIYYFYSLLYIYLRLLILQIITIKDLIIAYQKRQIFDLELIAVISLLGLIPNLFLTIAGGSGAYFLDLQKWLSISFILANCELFIQKILLKENTNLE